MAVMHMVWVRFNDGVPAERAAAHIAAVLGLAGRVPGVLDVKGGANFTDRAGGATHGLLVTLPDRTSLSAYLKHPEHLRVLGALTPDVAELRAMDIEV
jgi:hypothetical protein